MLSKPALVEVIHFNHHLRDQESEDDEAFCWQFARSLGLVLQVEHLYFEGVEDLQARARTARRQILKKRQKQDPDLWVATAHHQDDSNENLLITLAQGRLDRRLLPLPAFDYTHRTFKPLACFSKSQILEYCQYQGLSPRQDSSNKKPIYLRNVMRRLASFESSSTLQEAQKEMAFLDSLQKQRLMQKGISPHANVLDLTLCALPQESLALVYTQVSLCWPDLMFFIRWSGLKKALLSGRKGTFQLCGRSEQEVFAEISGRHIKIRRNP